MLFPPAFKALAQYPQFILYKLVEKKEKKDKIPINYRTGEAANPFDKSVQLKIEAALFHLRNHKNCGIGFVLTEQDPFWFLDIDNCLQFINGQHQWSKLSHDLISYFPNAAIEISTSLKGLHIIGSGKIPIHSCKNKELGIEFYHERRFIALTGINATGNAEIDFSNILPGFIKQYFNPLKSENLEEGLDNSFTHIEDDKKLISIALTSQSVASTFGTKASFLSLWEKDVSVLEKIFPSNDSREYDYSAADAALAQHLAFYTANDNTRIKKLMWESGLIREKWNRPDYLDRTISFACSKQKNFYQQQPKQMAITQKIETDLATEQPQLMMVNGSTFLEVQSQLKLFEGCVYVQDEHRILIPSGDLLDQGQFRATYGGYTFVMDLQNQRTSRNAWEAFTESQAFKKISAQTTCFLPEKPPASLLMQDDKIAVNLYRPIKVLRRTGNVDFFKRHISILLPNQNDQLILICYLAALIQYKGIKFQWAPFIQGVQGNGKGLILTCMVNAIGHRYCHLPSSNELYEKYNGFLYGTMLIGIDEMFIEGKDNNHVMEKMKVWITEEYQQIRRMHTDQVMKKVCCNFIILSNYKDGIRKIKSDRRYATFFTAQQDETHLMRDGLTREYFRNIWNTLKNKNGFEMITDFLYDYKIPDEYNPANKDSVPLTSSTEEHIEKSRGSIDLEVIEHIERGTPGFRGGFISLMQFDKLLSEMARGRNLIRAKREEILKSLGYELHTKLPGGRVNSSVLPDGARTKLYVIKGHPSLQLTNVKEIEKAYTKAQEDKEE